MKYLVTVRVEIASLDVADASQPFLVADAECKRDFSSAVDLLDRDDPDRRNRIAQQMNEIARIDSRILARSISRAIDGNFRE